METLLYVVLGLVAALITGAIWLYFRFKSMHNMLVALDERCDTAFADIDVHLKHRQNLIPSLLNTVKGVRDHEKDMVLGVIEARNKALGSMSADIKLKAEGNLTARLDTLMASLDKYPEIKTMPEFVNFRRELTDCENRITSARRFYNLAIEEYNTSLRMFPGNVIAAKLRLNSRQQYDLGIERTLIDEPMAVQF
ncbi:LemA family protein [Qipengyuania sp. NPDC077563]|uniref:LemA family protein n=1 Tax=Qipengyuania sp. NPDC077563 TaxID=3364497 RepID=UPI00384A81AF